METFTRFCSSLFVILEFCKQAYLQMFILKTVPLNSIPSGQLQCSDYISYSHFLYDVIKEKTVQSVIDYDKI
jgi:hypothetical protein